MKTIPLRKQYFRDVLRLGGLVLGLCLTVLTLFNAVEIMEHAENRREEVLEMLVLAGVLVATLPVVAWMAWRTSGRLLRPLRDIQEGVRNMREGDMNLRLTVADAQDELTYLTESLNAAFDAHREAQHRLEHFSANVSHQLRTPLTAMRAAGQVCLSQDRDVVAYRDCIGRMLEASERLTHMVHQLLQLARISSGQAGGDWPQFDFVALISEVAAPFIALAEDRQAAWELQLPTYSLLLRGNRVWLQEALANLLNNAMAYTPDPARFRLTVTQHDGWIHCQIEDNGPGIPPDQEAQLFQRFQRGSTTGDGGTGLGLAIVAEVIKIHGGSVEVGESRWGGAAFTCKLPSEFAR